MKSHLTVCVVLFALFVSVQSFGLRGFTYDGLKGLKVDRSKARLPDEKWIQQPVDHFNTRDDRTWAMRYYENAEFFNGPGPMLIMLGGEWEIEPSFIQTGQLYVIAKAHGAIMFYTEHRYYRRSRPVKLWYYQTCTEYGYYQTTSSKKSIFGTSFPLNYFVQLCKDLYGEYYNSSLVESGVRRTNLMYGGSLPDVQNVIFTNGNVDPWHTLSVLEDLNHNSPAILIDDASHCEDLNDDSSLDNASIEEARKRVRSIVAGWITSA